MTELHLYVCVFVGNLQIIQELRINGEKPDWETRFVKTRFLRSIAQVLRS
ncbi:MAG: hypothetical protein HC786_33300 [Richelia sp. CSU_2_1]|nr:hypothetical protein [Microcoleus sp. SU_5_6]NJL68532.1 hypothetical protein [Microcoleus sp. SM1_3_4]NJR26629.1 hypothetical protein [Richelia sp. CSU_2_1]